MTAPIRFLSVCSGIEAASVAFNPLGWEAVGFAEIDKAASKVLEHHYPSVKNYGDFTKIDVRKLGQVDILVGGTPCQDFSIAGLRAGLDGDRGNLTLEFLRLADRLNPEWVWWENVPGVISDKTDALKHFLDGLEDLKYVIDIDVLDAQYFGLAQRRKRVFVCAQRSDAILKARTLSSSLTIAQCLIESLRLTLAVLRNQSATGYTASGSKSGNHAHSLRRRMKLFGLDLEETAPNLLGNLAALQAWSEHGQFVLASENGNEDLEISEDTKLRKSEEEMVHFRGVCQSIEPSWKNILEDCLLTMKSSTTSTGGNAITESKIYSCAQMSLRIAGLITQSLDCSPTFWSAASSGLIAIKEFTNYARSANSDLFGDMEWILAWGDFIRQAERTSEALGNLRVRNFGEILPISQSLRGNFAPSRETRQGAAGTSAVGAGIGFGGGNTTGPIEQAACLTAKGQRIDFEVETFIAEETANCWRAKANDPHRADAGNYVAFAIQERAVSENPDAGPQGMGVQEGVAYTLEARHHVQAAAFQANGGNSMPIGEDICPTIVAQKDCGSGMPAVAFDLRGREGGAQFEGPHDTANIRAASGGSSRSYVAQQWAVRRLTPKECLRLQGFSDGYLDCVAADGPKYKMIGNSWAVPCISWIGERLAAAMKDHAA